MTTHAHPRYQPLIELHPAYLATLLCSILSGLLGIHVLLTVVTEGVHLAATDGQVLSAIILLAGLLMAALLTVFHEPVLHLWWWMGLGGALVLLAMAVWFGAGHH